MTDHEEKIRKSVPTLTGLLLSIVALTSARELRAAPTPANQGSHSEAMLTQEVHHQLVMLPYYSVFDNLAYKVEGSRVTLMGQVSKPIVKSDAERVVKSIEGVTAVDN